VIERVSALPEHEKIITFSRPAEIRSYLDFFNSYMEESGNASNEKSDLMINLVKQKFFEIRLLQEEVKPDYNTLQMRIIEIIGDLIVCKELLSNEQDAL